MFEQPRQKLSLKLIAFGKNYEQCYNHFCDFHDRNNFQSFELAVQNKKFLKTDCSGKKYLEVLFCLKDVTLS